MKLFLTTLFLCIIPTLSFAQDFDHVDSRVSLYPKKYAIAEQLAAQIEQDFTTDLDKVRAIYTWLAKNVSYDMQALYSGQTSVNFSYVDQEDLQRKLAAINTNTANTTLRTSKAICEGYAQTFKNVSLELGIPCMVVGGFSKTEVSNIGTDPEREDHAWNAVKIDKKWYLLDATWGAGYTNGNRWVQRFNDYFFLTDPNEFAFTHYPTEVEWLFTRKRISKKQFFAKPVYEKAFFQHNLKLISPLKGELIVSPDSNIEFIFGKIPQGVTLYYVFKGNRYLKKIEPTCDGSTCSFAIPFDQNKSTELLIFANQQGALEFKVTLKN